MPGEASADPINGKKPAMNPVAVATMLGIALGFFGLLAYALIVGEAWLLAVLAIVAIGVFVRWGE
ncbi:hypothetical protein ACTHQZ_02955 [Methylorubrum thiocyanatum]